MSSCTVIDVVSRADEAMTSTVNFFCFVEEVDYTGTSFPKS